MYWDLEVTSEEEELIIHQAAKKIHDFGMETAAILFLESAKPLAYIGGQMGRFFVTPYLPALGEEIGITGEKLMRVFEKRENVEKLITILEEMARGEYEKPEELKKLEEEREEMSGDESSETPEEGKKKEKWWKKYLPF